MRDAGVEVVGAGRAGCPCRAGGVLLVTIGSTFGVEEHRLQPRQHRVERSRLAGRRTSRRSSPRPSPPRQTPRGVHCQHELARGEVVVGAVVDPEQLGVALDLAPASPASTPCGCATICFEHAAHLERVAVLLVDEDVAAGERRLVEVPDRASSRCSGSARSRPHTAARPPRRPRSRADTSARQPARWPWRRLGRGRSSSPGRPPPERP